MITINYQSFGQKGFQLRLRLYQSGETRFISVTKMLKGVVLEKHWNQRKQQFTPSCPYSKENNDFLVQFKKKYADAALDWAGSVYGLIAYVETGGSEANEGIFLHDFIEDFVSELKQRKHADGSIKGTFEGYVKLDKRLREFCAYKHIKYEKLQLADIQPKFVNDMFEWVERVRKGKGYPYISSMLHSVLMRADRAELINWEKFRRCKWRGRNPACTHKYQTLTPDQCIRFASLTEGTMPDNPKSELFRDFCIFILYTGQSVCDAAALRYSDIKVIDGIEHFVFKRRKISEKQHVPCAVPINPVMKGIMDRWKSESKDGYVFPIRSRLKINTQVTNNGDIKRFLSNLNIWLKEVGKTLGCEFPLHTYVFRHTAITNYLSMNVPVIYVANLMGTSVKNCERIYYNNQGDRESRNKVLGAVLFK